jgi:hypothetical protein
MVALIDEGYSVLNPYILCSNRTAISQAHGFEFEILDV